MKPWIRKTLLGVFGASIVLGGLTACSSGGPHSGPMNAEKMSQVRGKLVARVSSKLDLDQAQKHKLDILADKLDAQRTAFVGKTQDRRAEMQTIVAGSTFDRAHAQAMVDETTRALQTNSPDVIAALADFYDSLNPSQQQKVREMMQHRRKGWMARG